MALNDTEMEIKLVAATDEVWTELFALPLIAELTVGGSIKEKKLESHYFDTVNGELARHGFAYRIRRTPDGLIATLKTAGRMEGGIAHRPEFETAVADLQPDLSVFDAQSVGADLPALLGGETPQLLFTVDVVRRQRELQLTEATRVEMAVDFGRILAQDKEAPVAEVEFELLSGSVADLLQFLAALTAQLPLQVAFKSKFRRGMDLLLSVHETEDASSAVVLAENKAWTEALYVVLADYVGALLTEQRRFDLSGCGMITFGQRLLDLRYWLAFAKPALKQEDYEHFQQLLSGLTGPFEALLYTEALLADWRTLSEEPLPLAGSVWMESQLLERRALLFSGILTERQDGVYTRVLLALWAWASKYPWAGPDADKISRYGSQRLQKWVQDLASTAGHDKLSATEACELFPLMDKLAVVTTCLTPALSLDADKALQKVQSLRKPLRSLCMDEYGKPVLRSLLKPGASRLAYRDAGLLAGWRLRAVQDFLPVIEKKWGNWLALVRKQAKRKKKKQK